MTPPQLRDLAVARGHPQRVRAAGLLVLAACERALLARPVSGADNPQGRLLRHLGREFDALFTFLRVPEVPATNWMAEQALRPAVVNRKVWGGNRTGAGARAQEVLMSVLETCKRAGRCALDFVSQTLCAFGNRDLTRPVLLPTR